MARWLHVLFICFLLKITSSQQRNQNEDEEHNFSNFPNNDFIAFLDALWKKVGVEKFMNRLVKNMGKIIRNAQVYAAHHFNRDFAKVKQHPSFWNIIEFIRKATFPSIVYGCTRLITFFSDMQRFLLRYLEKKCDEYIGRDAPFHPWNIIKQQDQTQVSFLIFIYLLAVSLVFIRILSWWNFAVYLAIGFLSYYIGGAYLLFRMLLTFTAFIWFSFDMIIQNPLQVAVIIIIIYFLRLAKTLLPSSGGSSQDTRPYLENLPDRGEFNSLADRIESIERKTNLLNMKLDKMSRSMERIIVDEK